jgi:hypothetical protein
MSREGARPGRHGSHLRRRRRHAERIEDTLRAVPVLEAFCVRLPFVTTDAGGIPFVVMHEKRPDPCPEG